MEWFEFFIDGGDAASANNLPALSYGQSTLRSLKATVSDPISGNVVVRGYSYIKYNLGLLL